MMKKKFLFFLLGVVFTLNSIFPKFSFAQLGCNGNLIHDYDFGRKSREIKSRARTFNLRYFRPDSSYFLSLYTKVHRS